MYKPGITDFEAPPQPPCRPQIQGQKGPEQGARLLAGRTMGHVGGFTAQKGTKLEATGELGSVIRARAEPHRGDFHENMAAF